MSINVVNVTVNSPEISTVNAVWTKKPFLKVDYKWNLSPMLLEPPVDNNKYIPNDNVTVDTTHKENDIIDDNSFQSNIISDNSTRLCDICYGNGTFVIVDLDGNIMTSNDGISWRNIEKLNSLKYNTICYGNNTFIAITTIGNSNICLVSNDNGITWKEYSISDTSYPWIDICYGDSLSRFVAITSDGKCAYSDDNGTTWTISSVDASITGWSAICYAGDKLKSYIIAGSNGFKVSSNGTNWVSSSLIPDPISDMCYGNGIIIAVGETKFYYSTDSTWGINGLTWNEGAFDDWQISRKICYGDGRFVCVGYYPDTDSDSEIFKYTMNGINWKTGKFDNAGSWYSICYGNEIFVAIGDNISATELVSNIIATGFKYRYHTFNGWDKGDFIITENTTINGVWESKRYLSVNYSWDNTSITRMLPNDDILYHENDLVTINNTDYSDLISDSIEYTLQKVDLGSSSSKLWKSVCYGNDKWVIASTEFAYSLDGVNWELGTVDISPSDSNSCIEYLYYANNTFIALGMGSSADTRSSYAAYSFDGINWYATEMPIKATWVSVCFGEGRFIAVHSNSDNNNYAACSYDGITWELIDIPYSAVNDICYGNGKFIMIPNTDMSSAQFAISSNGLYWETVTCSDTIDTFRLTSICYGNGKFVAISNYNSYIFYSTDGRTWSTKSALGDSILKSNIRWCGSMFVIIGNDTYIAYSYDGLNWTESIGTGSPRYYFLHLWYHDGTIMLSGAYTSLYKYITSIDIKTYDQFKSWDHTDFNITEDTTIKALWDTKNKLKLEYYISPVNTTTLYYPSYNSATYPNMLFQNFDITYHFPLDYITIDNKYRNLVLPSIKFNIHDIGISLDKYTDLIFAKTSRSSYFIGFNRINQRIELIESPDLNTSTVYDITDEVTLPDCADIIVKNVSDTTGIAIVGSYSIHYTLDKQNWQHAVDKYNNEYVLFRRFAVLNKDTYALASNMNLIVKVTYTISGFTFTPIEINTKLTGFCTGFSTYINNIYTHILIGANSNIAIYSTDFETWNEIVISDTSYDYIYRNNYLYAYHRNIILTYDRNNILNWTKHYLPSEVRIYNMITCYPYYVLSCWSNKRTYLAVSTDLDHWTYHMAYYTFTQGSMTYIMSFEPLNYYGNNYNKYDILCAPPAKILTLDLVYYQLSEWDKSDFNITGDTTICGTLIESSSINDKWDEIIDISFTPLCTTHFGVFDTDTDALISIINDNANTYAVIHNSDYTIYTSEYIESGNHKYTKLMYMDGVFFAIASDRYAYRNSTGWTVITLSQLSDKITWLGESHDVTSIECANVLNNGYGKYLLGIIADDESFVIQSQDCITWIDLCNIGPCDTYGDIGAVIYGDKYVALTHSFDDCYVYTSEDGDVWTTDTFTSYIVKIPGIIYAENKYICSACYYEAYDAQLYSIDGRNYTGGVDYDCLPSYIIGPTSIVYSNGVYMITGSSYSWYDDSPSYRYSFDGINWISGRINCDDENDNELYYETATLYPYKDKFICTYSIYNKRSTSYIATKCAKISIPSLKHLIMPW